MEKENKHTNQLINETSPYLLQHAYNPVDWHPWNEQTLNKAKSDLEDARTLLKKNAISNDEFNQLNLSLISAKSNYIKAKERYEKCSLRNKSTIFRSFT